MAKGRKRVWDAAVTDAREIGVSEGLMMGLASQNIFVGRGGPRRYKGVCREKNGIGRQIEL